jgi:3-hydroxybutyryl-CoA dehydrogenase
VPERFDAKLAVFGELDRACRPDAILATNTSSLTAIAARTAHPGRVGRARGGRDRVLPLT